MVGNMDMGNIHTKLKSKPSLLAERIFSNFEASFIKRLGSHYDKNYSSNAR